jgi:tRNA 5-methylaminomethyl-2-thiouridine biosynthesis bifunctional protein
VTLKPARLQWSENGDLESLDYGDVYFQRGAGFAESDYVFLQHNKLAERFTTMNSGSFHIGELGFGTGMNFLLTAKLFLDLAPADARLVFASIEKHPIPPDMLRQIYNHWPEHHAITQDIIQQYPPMIEGFHTLLLGGGRIRLMLCLGDVADMLPQIDGQFDAWFLDGFSPAKNPDMWQENIYTQVAARTKPQGTMATFSVTGPMRRTFRELGFDVQKVKGFGIKWSMTMAQKTGDAMTPPARQHIAVLGAGIAGCSAAYALARRGHRVTMIDRQTDIAQETSGNPVGIVYPKITVAPSALGHMHSHGFCYTRMMAAALPVASWRPCGVTHIDKDAAETTRHQKQISENALPADYAFHDDGGLQQPMAGYLSPPDFCAELSRHSGIEKIFTKSAASLKQDGDVWHVLDRNGDIICTVDAVVIALGNHSREVAQTDWLPLQSLRGQITYVTPTETSAQLRHVICHEGYITPPVNGVQYIGATFQKEPVAAPDIRAADHDENIQKLAHYLPQMQIGRDAVTGGRTGYRATTPDRLPMAGAVPDAPQILQDFADLRRGAREKEQNPALLRGLYITTGHSAHGMSSAPLCGEIIAAMISQEPLPVPYAVAQSLAPVRFLLRGLKRGQI